MAQSTSVKNKKSQQTDYDLIVIGTGSGGGVGANLAASMGKRVAIFEKDAIGGECPNFGCVPTKALLHAAEHYQIAKYSGPYGVVTGHVSFNYRNVREWKDLVVSRTGTAQGGAAFKDAGIEVHHGEAKFISNNTIQVGNKTYTAKNFLIATGSTVAIPPIPGLDKSGYHTYRDAIDYKKPPKSVFIIGGGPIGCEFAQIFSSFKSKVYIADGLPRLLGREDADAGELLGAIFKDRGIELYLNCAVESVRSTWRHKIIDLKTQSGHKRVFASHILVATGKRAAVLNLDLEKAGIEYDKGGIKVNSEMQTSNKNIYAAGDVVGPYLFTHTGEYQSHIAAHNMFNKDKILADYRAVPRCTFTDPEIASVGLNAETAKAEKIKIRVGTVPINIIGRANTSDVNNGFVKIITDEHGIVLGGAIVSPRAGEMIHEITLAVRLRLHVRELEETIHAYPTYSEAVKFAAANAMRAPLK